jgi:hypothetical protein
MVAYEDVAQQPPVVADGRLFEAVDQSASIRIIADKRLPGIAERHRVINGTLKLDAEWPWHVRSLVAQQTN